MARPLRLQYEGAIYHITVRGNNRQDIFLDDEDRKYLLSHLSKCVEFCGVRLYLFCIMTNHFHLVLETPKANLSQFMQKVLTGFTVYFNHRHSRSGHVTQGRYTARLVEGDDCLRRLSRYVHLNPIKINKMNSKTPSERAKLLRSYTWSSYRSYIGESKEYPFIEYGPMLALMPGRGKKRHRIEYRKFVEACVGKKDEVFIEELVKSPRSIGDEKYRDWVDDYFLEVIGKRKNKEDISFRKVEGMGLPSDIVLKEVSKAFKIDASKLTRRSRNSASRSVAGMMLCKYSDYSQRQAAEVLGLKTGAAVSYQIAQVEKLRREDAKHARKIAKLEKTLERKQKGRKHE